MLRRLRRPAAALCAVLLVPALAACGGSDDSATPATSASESSSEAADSSAAPAGEVDGVSFDGEVGQGITGTWSSAIEPPSETKVTTLVEGDGEQVADGDNVSIYLWVGNGTSQEQVYSDYDSGAPETVPNDPAQVDAVFAALLAGQKYGARVAAVTTASEVFGDADNQLGIKPTDSMVFVADLVEKAEVAPSPTDDQAHDVSPDQQPSVVEKDGTVTGLDFSGIDEPALDTPVQRVVLKKGTGAALKATDTVTVNYLGSTYDADAPFDESFSTGKPLNSALSGLIQGWTIGLTGVKVGSRVLLQIPPGYGYGAQETGTIPANSTLWFVIDVVKAE